MKINYKVLAKYILIPLLLGAIVGFITNSFGGYKEMIQPSFAPPGVLFPIVWSILYILMGISRYMIDNESNNNQAIKYYNMQLIINLLWSFIFFTFKLYLLSFIWIIALIIVVLLMLKEFYYLSKLALYIQIPYVLWLTFAAILNFAIFTLN